MTDQEMDRLMRRVLLDSLKREYTAETVSVMQYKLSWRHHRQMNAMLKDPLKWLHNKTKPVWKIVVQRIAVVLLVTSLSLGGLMAISPTVRAAVIRWVTEWYETHIVYRFSGEYNDSAMPEYEIVALPQGYEEIKSNRITNDNYISLWYENESGDLILLDYMYMQQGSAMMVEPENGDTVIDVSVHDNAGQLYLPDTPQKMSTLVWTDQQSGFCFVIKAACEAEDILHMAESVFLVK